MKEAIQNLSQDAVQKLRKKGQERLTIMIIPHGQDKVFSLQLNWYLILFCSAILILLVFLSFYGIYETHERKLELERLGLLYGSNFKSALLLEEQSHKLKKKNKALYRNLEKITTKLNVPDEIISILPSLDQSRVKAQEALLRTSRVAEEDSLNHITYLPPIIELKTISQQINDKSALVNSLKYFLDNSLGLFQKVPLGRPFAPTQTLRDSSQYGARSNPFNKKLNFEFHAGYDTRGPIGSIIHATAHGTVHRVMNSRTRGYGKGVLIRHSFGFYSLYAHLSKVHVKLGEKVKKHQLIGELGSTGRSTGPHIHYEVRFNQVNNHINPKPFICAIDYKTNQCQQYRNKNKPSSPNYFTNL